MWNLNEAEKSEPRGQLIPEGTVARAVVNFRPGQAGEQGWFKLSRAGDQMLDADFVIENGPFARRHVFNNMMVTGNPTAVSITMRELRGIIEGHHNLHPDDMSPAAQEARNNAAPWTINGMSCCILIGIEKGTNGYEDRNVIKAILTPTDKKYLAPGQEPPAAPQAPAAAPQAASPAWQAQAAPQAAPAAPAPAPQAPAAPAAPMAAPAPAPTPQAAPAPAAPAAPQSGYTWG